MMKNSLRQEVSKCRGVVAPWARLSQHDGKIIEVSAPRRRKIIGPAPGENPQRHTYVHKHTAQSVALHCCTFSIKKKKVLTRQLGDFHLLARYLSVLKPIYIQTETSFYHSVGPRRSHSPVADIVVPHRSASVWPVPVSEAQRLRAG